MLLKKISAPAWPPFDLQAALEHLGEQAGVNDAYIGGLVGVVAADFESRTESTLMQCAWRVTAASWAELRHGRCGQVLRLRFGPVVDVLSVKYIDTAGVEQTMASSDYRLAGDFLEPVQRWPDHAPRLDAVRIEYTAGLAAAAQNVPQGAKHWMLLTLSDLYENRSGHSDKPAAAHAFYDSFLQPFCLGGF
ncbi:MAG: head-tail connector protein [Plesiomonas shigelloides]